MGGELTVHKKPKGLGNIIKAAREKSGITIENLAYKVGITERTRKRNQALMSFTS